MKLNFLVKLDDQTSRNQIFLTAGVSAGIRNNMTIKDVIKKSISNNVVDFSEQWKDPKQFIEKIFAGVNDKRNIEYFQVINKRTTGRNFNSILREPKRNQYRASTDNIAFVFRIKEGSELDGYFHKNTIILEADFYNYIQEEVTYAYFKLQNISLVNLPVTGFPVTEGMKDIDGIYNITPIFTQDKEQLKFTSQDLGNIKFLTKPIDIYENDGRLQITEWTLVTKHLKEFIMHKEKNSFGVFAWEKNINVEDRSAVSMLTVIPKDSILSQEVKYNIFNQKDTAIKANFRYKSSKAIDFSKTFE